MHSQSLMVKGHVAEPEHENVTRQPTVASSGAAVVSRDLSSGLLQSEWQLTIAVVLNQRAMTHSQLGASSPGPSANW